jgi:hypothetical protein
MLETHPINFRRKGAAQYLNEKWGIPRAARTLAKLACIGGGPPMIYCGKIPLYPIAGLDAYAKAQLSGPIHSTSERKPAAGSAAQNRDSP